MSQVALTFSLVDYFPPNFNFSEFSFIISSESRTFEQELSFLSKNKITHKFLIPRKDVKYSIKVTKKNSLIGISEITIPSYIFQKREKNCDKSCIINMTDSVKRVLFGNISSDNIIKIEIHCELEYKEKEKNTNSRMNYSTNTNKKNNKGMKNLKDIRSSGTFSHKNILENKKNGINSNIKKQYSNSKASSNNNVRSPKISRPKAPIFNNSSFTSKDSNKIKDTKNKTKKEKGEKINDLNNKKEIKENKEIKEIKEIKEKNEMNIDTINNESLIDDELNKDINEKNEDFEYYINNFKENHPLEKLDSMNDIHQLSEYTKNSLLELIEYQIQFYSLLKNGYNRKNKLNNLMVQYNEKFRNTKKEINKMDEMKDICEIKSEILDKNKLNNEKNILSMKINELNNFKIINEGNCKEKLNNQQNKENEESINKIMEKGKNVLIKVLKHCFDKYGPINKIFTMTNSTEPERINIMKLANKYNLPLTSEIKEEEEVSNNEKNEEKEEKEEKEATIKQEEEKDNDIDKNTFEIKDEQPEIIDNNNDNENITNEVEKEQQKEEPEKNIFEGKITKWEYVSTEKPDKIDKKLELYLKYFYSKRSFPVVIFKKTSTNNYEYGKQKVMIKIEGDTIRVRYLGGYIILDKFIELNAANEEKKLKKINEKNNSASSTSRKKEINQKKKNK